MYHKFYNLTIEPFRLSPDHRFCYKHRSYGRAKTYMNYALDRGEGFIVVTGAPGTGKSTLIEDLFVGLRGQPVVKAKLVSTQLEADDLVRMVAFSFDIKATNLDKATLISQLTQVLRRHRRAGRRSLLVVDEAQDLTKNALEELRLLTNLQQDSAPLLQIFLVGQQELRDKIRDKSMEQLHQRIIAACHLEPLKAEETRAYVEHRLVCAGWNNDPCLSDAVFYIIHQYSGGVPRRINLVCSRLFLHGGVEEKHRLLLTDLQDVLRELNEENLDPLNHEFGDIQQLISDVPIGLSDECIPWTQAAKAIPEPQPAAAVQPVKMPAGNLRAAPVPQLTPAQPHGVPVGKLDAPGNKAGMENSPVKQTAARDVLGEIDHLMDDLGKLQNNSNKELSPARAPVIKTVKDGTSDQRSKPEAVPAKVSKRSPSIVPANAVDNTDTMAGGKTRRHGWLYWSAMSLFTAALIAFVLYALNIIYGLKLYPFTLIPENPVTQLLEGDETAAAPLPVAEEPELPRAGAEIGDEKIPSQDPQMGEPSEKMLTLQDRQQGAVDSEPGEPVGKGPEIAPESADENLEKDAAVELPPAAATMEMTESLPIRGVLESAVDIDSASDRDGLVTVKSSARIQENAADIEKKTRDESQDGGVATSSQPALPPATNASRPQDPGPEPDQNQAQELGQDQGQNQAQELGQDQGQDQGQNQAQDQISSLEQALRPFPFYIDRLEDGSLQVDLGNTVSFASDSVEFSPSSGIILDKLAGALKPYTDISLLVVGHTDSTGPEIYNLVLSKQRAATVADYLQKLRGEEGDWVQVEGRGESEPVEPGNRGRNRRIVLYIAPLQQG